MKMLIKNVNIITPYEIKRNGSLSIEDGIISNILDGDASEEYYDKIIDGENEYLAPGLIDIHNHGNFGHDVMEATFESLISMADFHMKNGVTSFLATPMTESLDKIESAIKNVRKYIEKEKKAPKVRSQVLGIYLEGPYFSMERKGAQPPQYIKNPNVEEIKNLIELSNDNIKVVALAPELKGAKETIKYLKNKGITVSAGHTDGKYDEVKYGIELGISQATHLYNGMRPFSHREPGVIGAVLTDERVSCEIICDGIHLHPAAMKLAVKAKGKDGIILVSDAMMATGLKDGEYKLGSQNVFVKKGAARLADGTLAGSTLTLNRAVWNMVHMVGVPLEDAVRMASLNPAKSIGVGDRKGSIEIGKDADLIIFNDDLNILKVIIHGLSIE
ncbi:N-acetylglucosamine-6-phosphate deacetylase [Sporanaerobacter sp. PP17-6a]|uniref:N-acetylglucosamine-6-phosphate deacetylase n=1 Tax=Sporanaerobacter sp. PP17-6a TaxID=1891289 RepID=UPI0008A005D5|nr:N-acetylglucosamine-6-phosphate deacetylase [Sporanaerobacter sp. PP17-6a]SCL87442.1 N-acetylglucosamine-6-phosphate deacetylase [Sporanaerobacter sp. PP17-6a]